MTDVIDTMVDVTHAWPKAVAGRVPTHLYIEAAAACDMDCPMCVTLDHRFGRRKLMPTAEIRTRLIEPAARLGVRMLVISGGEPTLRKDLPDLISAGIDNGMGVWLATNLLNTPEPRLREIVGLLRPPSSLAVSYDSHVPAEMAAIRGGDFFGRVDTNLRKAVAMARGLENGPRIGATIIVQPENIASTMKTVDHVLDDIGVDIVGVFLRHDYHYVTPENADRQTRADWVCAHRRELIALGMRVYARAARDRRVLVRGVLDDWVRFVENPQTIRRRCQADDHLFFNAEGKLRACMFGTEIGDARVDDLESLLGGAAGKARHDLIGKCSICLLSCN